MFDGLLLGFVQGLTEFLPISSSGHLLLAEDLLGFRPQGVYFEVGLHVATLLSVVIAYRTRLLGVTRGLLRRDQQEWRYVVLLVIGSLPAGVAGLGFRDVFTSAFETGPMLGAAFLVTAAVLWSTRWTRPTPEANPLTVGAALLIGLVQAFAILPAISRSGMTIAMALWLGIRPVAAAEFSFLLAIIAIGGSGLVEVSHLPPGVDVFSPGLIVAFAAAMLSGVWAIRFLVRLLDRGRFHAFAWYCAGVGLITLVWYGARA